MFELCCEDYILENINNLNLYNFLEWESDLLPGQSEPSAKDIPVKNLESSRPGIAKRSLSGLGKLIKYGVLLGLAGGAYTAGSNFVKNTFYAEPTLTDKIVNGIENNAILISVPLGLMAIYKVYKLYNQHKEEMNIKDRLRAEQYLMYNTNQLIKKAKSENDNESIKKLENFKNLISNGGE